MLCKHNWIVVEMGKKVNKLTNRKNVTTEEYRLCSRTYINWNVLSEK